MFGNGYLTDLCRITLVEAATAAGQTEINSASLDMSADGGWSGVCFFTCPSTIVATAVTNFYLEGSADDSSFAELSGLNHTIADDDDGQAFALDLLIPKPSDVYVRASITRTTANVTVGEIWAIQYRGRATPIVQNVANTMTCLRAIFAADA